MFQVDLSVKKGLVMGVANQRSIAWAIAQPLAQAGARLAFSYQGDRLRPALEKLTADLDRPVLLEADVTDDAALDRLFEQVGEELGGLDYLVHSIGYAPAATFERPFLHTTRDDWRVAMDVSAYSLVAVCQRAAPLMTSRRARARERQRAAALEEPPPMVRDR